MSVDYRLAIDPGDRHVGYAESLKSVVRAGEWTPSEAVQQIRAKIQRAKQHGWSMEIIVEVFALYPSKAAEQAGSEFLTSQLIGAIKLIAHDHGVPVIMQQATIKKPTAKQMRARGIRPVPGSTHSRDAQKHLWHRILRQEGGK